MLKTFDHQFVEPVVSESREGIFSSFFFEDPFFSSMGKPDKKRHPTASRRWEWGGVNAKQRGRALIIHSQKPLII